MAMNLPLILAIVSIVLNAVLIFLFLTRKNTTDTSSLEHSIEDIRKSLREENSINRNESRQSEKAIREELNNSIKNFGDSLDKRLAELMSKNENRLERIRETVDTKMQLLQKDNSEKLEKMRMTVDEKLQSTLEKRLGESFKLVSDRLEQVHKGLGEMQTLASGVGDLKRVLTNVKTRGTWGEVQLANLLEQILTIEQYDKNVATKNGSADRVEFAIKLPGKDDRVKQIWMPIDAKFPIEDYQRLITAQENGSVEDVETLTKALENRIKSEAKDIFTKYIDPPYTTDFALLYLPIEGLYAEVTQRRGLAESLQRQYRVIVCGPNTIAALLNSLQMGFRSLAIEKRSSEVWSVLGAIKTEFGKFGDLLEKTHDKLKQASNTIEDATRKSRTIERKLGRVQELPSGDSVPDLPDSVQDSLLP
jgi:DNA recombination protein RmuC